MFGPRKGGPPPPSAIRQAAGLPPRPGYLDTPRATGPSSSPEFRRLVWFGAGLLFCVVLTFVLAPRPTQDTPQTAAAALKAEETAEERKQRLLTIYNGALAKVSDGADFDETPAYGDVLHGVSRHDLAEVHQRSTEWFDWAKAVNEPALVRGRFFKLRGMIGAVQTVKLSTPVGNITDVWRCFVSEPDGESEKLVVDMLEKPNVSKDDMQRSIVDVEAMFFRLVGFDAAPRASGSTSKPKEPKHFEVPYLIGRAMTVHVEPPRGPQGTARIVLWVGIVAVAVVLAVVMARSRQATRSHPALLNKPGVGIREMFEMRRREEESKRAGAGPPTPQAPPAPPAP